MSLKGGYFFWPSAKEIRSAEDHISRQVYLNEFSEASAANRKYVLENYLKAHYGPGRQKQEARKNLRDIVLSYEEKRLAEQRRIAAFRRRMHDSAMWYEAEKAFKRDLDAKAQSKHRKSQSRSKSRFRGGYKVKTFSVI